MSNINQPSFTFGYWRPWNENANLFESYLDYKKDSSLVEYNSDLIGNYINKASKEQVQAINNVGQAIGQGMNILTTQIAQVSNQLSTVNESLRFINKNLDLLVEQQKLSNLLLQDISNLLRIPDSQKESSYFIQAHVK